MNRNWVCLRHFLDQLAEALGIGVVERRVDFVEQAERRGVELKKKENTRAIAVRAFSPPKANEWWCSFSRGERPMTARRNREFLARHDELGLAAAKEHREHLAKTAIHGIERVLQQGARFAVDTADRVLGGSPGRR